MVCSVLRSEDVVIRVVVRVDQGPSRGQAEPAGKAEDGQEERLGTGLVVSGWWVWELNDRQKIIIYIL